MQMRLFLSIFNQYEMSLHYAFIVLKALKIDRWRLSTQSKKKNAICFATFISVDSAILKAKIVYDLFIQELLVHEV